MVLAGPLPARRKVIIIIIALPAKYTSAAVAQMSWEQPTTVRLDLRPTHEMDPCLTLLKWLRAPEVLTGRGESRMLLFC